ncbi:hypothetical protein DDB_G0272122 [Dictyostelium discoideum AX4]|uniref:Uncharacterized protein n=1 Tax=Dictyostelium discoideum TaxID=44689 RepID=Q8ST27_DICDI|nr:hypothetical protein DDB_G0272122 [Dictyostelium discoideum AX4]EAL71213.1 hypothetical protein DDB_G0272122 [Dictyostelium discoideum AX4]|eukprot:XP_645170.1 hypothetical protein DDB_G0272122 [Dictyostelium discoideum AX4]
MKNEKENLLLENLKKITTIAYHKEIEIYLSKLKDDKLINMVKGLVLSPEKFVKVMDKAIKYNEFTKSPSIEHPLFNSLILNINKVSQVLLKLDEKNDDDYGDHDDENQLRIKEDLKMLLNGYIEQLEIYSKNLVELAKKKDSNLYEENPLVLIDSYESDGNLRYRNLNSLKSAYQISSYDPDTLSYVKDNEFGTSYVSRYDEMYFKVDNGNTLLRPAKEHSIFQFYKQLYPDLDYSLVTPTKLLYLSRLPFLPIESSNEKKEFSKQVQENNLSNSIGAVFENNPTLKETIKKCLKERNQSLFIQSSLKVDGDSFTDVIENFNKKIGSLPLDEESFSAHVLSNFLIMSTDAKDDNYIIEKGTKRIIGIDNDNCLQSDEIEIKNNDLQIGVKNILFTIEPLMLKSVNSIIRNQFIKHNPFVFILNWINSLKENNEIYETLFSKTLEAESRIANFREDMEIPWTISIRFISNMIDRFKILIQQLSISEEITHQDLFKQVHPFAYYYYNFFSKHFGHTNVKDQARDIFHGNLNLNQLLFRHGTEAEKKLLKDQINQYLKEQSNPLDKSDVSFDKIIRYIIAKAEFKDFQSNNLHLIQWLEMVFNYFKNEMSSPLFEVNPNFIKSSTDNTPFYKIHKSFFDSKKLVLISLFRGFASEELINKFIKFINYSNQEIISTNEKSILHSLLIDFDCISNSNSEEKKKTDQVSKYILLLIKSFGFDINLVEDGKTILDLVVLNKQFELFKLLIDLGAGKNSDQVLISNYYCQQLTDDERYDFRPYLKLLFQQNPKISWAITLNKLLPIVGLDDNDDEDFKKRLISPVIGEKRIVSKEFWNILFDSETNQPIRRNKHGGRSVTFINDVFGNGIYFKFEPQFPGTELSVIRLSEALFGFCSPYCELASINGGTPVLLIQQVEGITLADVIDNPDSFSDKESQELLNKLDQSNISKQLVTSMLVNNADGNLGNFIISQVIDDSNHSEDTTNSINKYKYKLYSIDNEQCFMPSVAKVSGPFNLLSKVSYQTESALYLFEQMKQPIHQDVIDAIKNMDIYKVCRDWVTNLIDQHDASIDHFKSNEKLLLSQRITIIGISFSKGMIKQMFSKLTRLQQIITSQTNEIKDKENNSPDQENNNNNNNNFKKITHFELLEELEPMIANRYRDLLFNSDLSLVGKYRKYFNLKVGEDTGTTKNKSKILLESRDLPDSNEIQNALWSGNFGPRKALEELDDFCKMKFQNIHHFFEEFEKNSSSQFKIEINQFATFLRETNFKDFSETRQKSLFEILKNKEIASISLVNSIVTRNELLTFKLDTLVVLDLSECLGIKTLTYDYAGFIFLKFPSLKRFKIDNCINLTNVRIEANNLSTISAINCKALKEFYVIMGNVTRCIFENSISNLSVLDNIKKFSNLVRLDISGSNLQSSELFLHFNNLEVLLARSIKKLKCLYFNLPVAHTILLEGCDGLVDLLGEARSLKVLKVPPSVNGADPIHDPRNNLLKAQLARIKINLIGTPDNPYFSHFRSNNDYVITSETPNNNNINNNNNSNNNDSPLRGFVSKDVEIWTRGDQNIGNHNLFNISNYIFVIYDLDNPKSIASLTLPLNLIYTNTSIVKSKLERILLVCGASNSSYITISPVNRNLIKDFMEKYNFKDSLFLWSPTSFNHRHQTIQSFKNKIDNYLFPKRNINLESKETTDLKSFYKPDEVRFNNEIFLRCFNDCEIPDFNPQNLLLDSQVDLYYFQIPDQTRRLYLKNIDQDLVKGVIPKTIVSLHIGSTMYQLKPNSIPSSVETLYLEENFSSSLLSGIIPNSVTLLVLNDIKTPILAGSIPSSVRILKLANGFNQNLTSGLIPETVKNLYLYDIKSQLSIGSIPSGVISLTLGNGFNQSITKGIIPSTVGYLHVYNIKEPLLIESIPEQLTCIEFHNSYNYPLTKGIITNGIEKVHIHSITYPLIENETFPPSVTSLHIHQNYNHIIHPNTIPSTIKYLKIENLKQPLIIGSIPKTLTTLEVPNLDYFKQNIINILPLELPKIVFTN